MEPIQKQVICQKTPKNITPSYSFFSTQRNFLVATQVGKPNCETADPSLSSRLKYLNKC